MSETTTSKWNAILDDLGLELEPTDAPAGHSGTWALILSQFSRHSFARLLLGTDAEATPLRLEIALGPPPSDPGPVLDLLKKSFQDRTQVSWSVLSSEIPWILEAEAGAEESPDEALGRAAALCLRLCEQFETNDKPGDWSRFLGELIGQESESTSSDSHDDSNAASTKSASSPFESIGTGGQSAEDSEATITASATTRVGDAIHLALGFAQVLAPHQSDALLEGLQNHLHAKYEARARPIEDEERPELRLNATARTALFLAVEPTESGAKLSSLRRDLDGFLERLKKFSSFGVDLFEYLGVGDTVLDREDSQREEPVRRSTTPSRSLSTSSEVVFDLRSSGTGGGASDALRARDFTDPRLQRDDATTALVDVVLRHPGYSDRRIGQVLSILLSIDFHDATTIADAAPCVIAWGLGRQRALSFQEVIESAGGKVLLVEPGTFGER